MTPGGPGTRAVQAPWRSLLAAPRLCWPLILAVLLAAVAIPLVGSNYTLEVLTNAWLYVVLCLGLNIVVGYAI